MCINLQIQLYICTIDCLFKNEGKICHSKSIEKIYYGHSTTKYCKT